jgi:hypothetical protein
VRAAQREIGEIVIESRRLELYGHRVSAFMLFVAIRARLARRGAVTSVKALPAIPVG